MQLQRITHTTPLSKPALQKQGVKKRDLTRALSATQFLNRAIRL